MKRQRLERWTVASFELQGHLVEIQREVDLLDQFSGHHEWFVDGKLACHFGWNKKHAESYKRQFLGFGYIK